MYEPVPWLWQPGKSKAADRTVSILRDRSEYYKAAAGIAQFVEKLKYQEAGCLSNISLCTELGHALTRISRSPLTEVVSMGHWCSELPTALYLTHS